MRRMHFSLVAALSALAAAADGVPAVSDVAISQDAATRAVTVAYTLSGAPGIVTLGIATNGVAVGPENVWGVSGDVNRKVEPGARTITWHPDKSWPDRAFDAGVVSATVTACATNDPPDYLAVNLLKAGDVKYYTCAAAVPDGVTNDLYKTSSILMRRIRARGVPFVQGAALDEPGRWNTDEREARSFVKFRNDYYIGVYETTQRQWWHMTGAWPSAHSNLQYRATRPVENVSLSMIRLNKYDTNSRNTAYYYPNDPFPTSFLGLLRAHSGLPFDVTGVVQFEYASRAGHGDYKWGDGTPILSTLSSSGRDPEDPSLNRLGRNAYNNAAGAYAGANKNPSALETPDYAAAGPDVGTAPVGSYEPNSWGLYDMHGNVWELCGDMYYSVGASYGDVPNEGTEPKRTVIGGCYNRGAWRARASFAVGADAKEVSPSYGFRLAIILP